LILQLCDLLSLKLCGYFSYELLLDGVRLSTQTLHIGGVYTLLIVEDNGPVSKDSFLLQQHYKEL
jgi:hypothetical protein